MEFIIIIVVTGGWDSSFGIATIYVVGSPMLRHPTAAIFSGPYTHGPSPIHLTTQWVPFPLPGIKWPGVGDYHVPLASSVGRALFLRSPCFCLAYNWTAFTFTSL